MYELLILVKFSISIISLNSMWIKVISTNYLSGAQNIWHVLLSYIYACQVYQNPRSGGHKSSSLLQLQIVFVGGRLQDWLSAQHPCSCLSKRDGFLTRSKVWKNDGINELSFNWLPSIIRTTRRGPTTSTHTEELYQGWAMGYRAPRWWVKVYKMKAMDNHFNHFI